MVILLLKHENRKANYYLSALSFLLVLWLFDIFFRVSGLYQQNPNFYFLPIYYSLGFGPLVFFYTRQLTKRTSTFTYYDLLHLIPVGIQFIFYVYLQLKGYSFRRTFWMEVHSPCTYNLELSLSFLSLLVYLLLSRKRIKHYKYGIENSFSSINRITLQWLNRLHAILFIVSFFWLLETLGRLIWDFYPITPFSTITIGVVIIFIAIGGILQKDLGRITDALPVVPSKVKSKVALSAIELQQLKRMQEVMHQEQLFLQQELTLKEFAKHLNHSPRETSRLINQGLNISFIDFVNQYRIAYFKVITQQEQFSHLSLLGLAYESGFNSKATFNRVFKKMEGQSPSSYQKRLKTGGDTSQNTY